MSTQAVLGLVRGFRNPTAADPQTTRRAWSRRQTTTLCIGDGGAAGPGGLGTASLCRTWSRPTALWEGTCDPRALLALTRAPPARRGQARRTSSEEGCG